MGDLATTVTKRLSGVSGGGRYNYYPYGKNTLQVRKSWSDAKSQIGFLCSGKRQVSGGQEPKLQGL